MKIQWLLHRAFLAMMAMILTTAACGGSSGHASTPTGPTNRPGPLTGTWTGTMSDSIAGAGTLRLTINQNAVNQEASVLSGTWTSTFSDATYSNAGVLSGSTLRTTIFVSMTPNDPRACSSTAGATIYVTATVNADHMTGTHVGFNCTGAGQVDLTRQ